MTEEKRRQLRIWVLAAGVAALLGCGERLASGASGPAEDAGKMVAAGGGGTNVAAIPLAELSAQAEAAFATVQSINGNLTNDTATGAVQQDLPGLTRESSVRMEESSKMLSSNPSLGTLRRLNREWQGVSEELADWKRSLMKRVTQLDEDRARLSQLEQVWQATRRSVVESQLPPEVLAQVDRILAAVEKTQAQADAQQKAVLGLQTRVAEQDGRTRHTLNVIERGLDGFLRRLLVRDGVPIWSPKVWADSAENLVEQSRHSFSRQAQALGGYVERKGSLLVLQAGLFLAMLAGLMAAGRILRRLEGDAASHEPWMFDSPVATALFLALLAGGWIHPQAPRLFWAISGAVALIPATLVVRRLLDQRLLPVLNVLTAVYFLDQIRMLAASQAVLSRLLLLAEVLGAALFTLWLRVPGRFETAPEESRFRQRVGGTCRVVLIWCVLAFMTDLLGYVSLGKLLGHSLLESAYMALVWYAVARIIDGLFSSALCHPRLARMGLVRRHRDLLCRRTRDLVGWAAILCWGAYVLEALSLRTPLVQCVREALSATWAVGSFKGSLGDIVLFGGTVWGSFLVSRLLRFVLEEEVYSRVKLAPGLHYSISKLVNYSVLVLGFFTAMAVLGFDLTRLTILVGAFGVGLGFGLQNVINNLVSGLILLFERPIKVGDVIQLAGSEGVVKHIGIRASIVRGPNGSEFIVPNGSLVSDMVTNWTYSDSLRRIDLPVVVAVPAEAREVMELLKAAAAEQPTVLKDPPPQALLGSFGGDSMSFELRVWTSQAEDWSRLRSDLALAVRATLADHQIAVK